MPQSKELIYPGAPEFLDFTFNLYGWEREPQRIFTGFLWFTLAAARTTDGQPVPDFSDGREFLKRYIPRKHTVETNLLPNYALYFPFFFPHALNVLSHTGQLCDSGLKFLADQALETASTSCTDPNLLARLKPKTPLGIWGDQETGQKFLRSLASCVREETGHIVAHEDTGVVFQKVNIQEDPKAQRGFLEEITKSFREANDPFSKIIYQALTAES